MATKTVTHHYTESGLSNIWIECRRVIDDAGEETLIIRNIKHLHKLIAHEIVLSDGVLSGDELKFLRSEMGMTQTELGELVHRERLTISRWERGKSAVDGAIDAFIRMLASRKLKLNEVDAEEIWRWGRYPFHAAMLNIKYKP